MIISNCKFIVSKPILNYNDNNNCKIDRNRHEVNIMKQYCFVHCFGKAKVPDKEKWKNNVLGGVNRLYYILGGEGGYIRNGEKKHFKKGFLYFIPSYVNTPTWSSYEPEGNRLDHLYLGFEVLPPIMTDQVIEIDPKEDPTLNATINVWMSIAEEHRSIRKIDNDALDYLKSIIHYIVSKIIDKNNIKPIDDKTILYVLEEIHKNISEPISVHKLAENVHMSYDGFIKKFKSNLRTTPYKYIKSLRTRTAIALRNEGATLEEAAARCGYSESAALLHAISNEKYLHKIK